MNDIAEKLVKKQTKNETDLEYLMYQLEKVELFKSIFQYSSMKMSKDFLQSLETIRIPKLSVVFQESSPIDDYSYLVLKGSIIILTNQAEKLNRTKYFDSLMSYFFINNPGQCNIDNSMTTKQFAQKKFPMKQNFVITEQQNSQLLENEAQYSQNSDSFPHINRTTNKLGSQADSTSHQDNFGEVQAAGLNENQDLSNQTGNINQESQSTDQQNQESISNESNIRNSTNNVNYQEQHDKENEEINQIQQQFGRFYGYINEGNLFGEESISSPLYQRKKLYSYTAVAGSDSIIALVNTSLVNHILKKIDETFSSRVQKIQNIIGAQNIEARNLNYSAQKINHSYVLIKNEQKKLLPQKANLLPIRMQSPQQKYRKQQFEQLDAGYQRQDITLDKLVESNNKKRKKLLKSSNSPIQYENKSFERAQSPRLNCSFKNDAKTITQTKVIITNVLRSKCSINSSMQSIFSPQYQNDKMVQQIQYQTKINRSQSPPCSRQESKNRLQKLLLENHQNLLNSPTSLSRIMNNTESNQFQRKNRSHSPLSPIRNLQNPPLYTNKPNQPNRQVFLQQNPQNNMSPQEKLDLVKKIYVSKNQNQVIRDKQSIRQLYEKETKLDKSISYSNFLLNNSRNNGSQDKNDIHCLVVSASSFKSKI